MNALPFIKMHGLGNDFVVLDARQADIGLTPEIIRALGDRRRGVGFDQLLTLLPSRDADCYMRIDNSDGSGAGACGNGTRCVGRLLLEESGKSAVTIDSPGGLLHAEAADSGLITVNMGKPDFDWRMVPLAREMDTLHVDLSVTAEGCTLSDPVALSMGNPHAVFFVDDAEAVPLEAVGPLVESHALFPDRVNCSVASLRDDGSIRLRVYERGAGITQACGSGTCATYAAARKRGLVDGETRIDLDGGPLFLDMNPTGEILMTGAAAYSYRGEIAAEMLNGATA
ncbi:MAG: diaminopimelate epimerase [Minwuia sp.]|uniref:diaminopimelate epimerase n=1 Tax=Minwuia sp. TaxID=2493630 RepID=UPI003A8412CE